MLWGVMKRRLGPYWKRGDDIWEKLQAAWRSINKMTIDSLVKSFLFRCQLILRLNGESATPFLAAHRPLPDGADPRPVWTAEDEQCLRSHVERVGHKWALIGRAMNRRPTFIKNKWRAIVQIERNCGYSCLIQPPVDCSGLPDLESALGELDDLFK